MTMPYAVDTEERKTMTSPPIRVLIADDHELLRRGIRAVLSAAPDIEVVGDARDGEELVALVRGLLPDVVLTDIEMPGMGGLEAMRQIHEHHPGVRIVAISGHDDAESVRAAFRKGACGYVMKAATVDMEHAVRAVMTTGSYFSPTVARLLMQAPKATAEEELTTRQVEILTRIAQGLSAKEIGFELGISPKTVDVHRARLMQRLGLKDTASLTLYALRSGLIKQ